MVNKNNSDSRAIRARTLMLAKTGILIGIMLVFHATGIAYIKVGIFSLTVMAVPLIVGSIAIGKTAGMALGVVFGGTVLLLPETGFFLNINPVATVVLCVGVRVFLGFICNVIFKAVKKFDKTKLVSYAAAGFCTAVLNTLLMMGGLVLFFGNSPEFNADNQSGAALFAALIGGVALQGVIEAALCSVIGGAVAKAVDR